MKLNFIVALLALVLLSCTHQSTYIYPAPASFTRPDPVYKSVAQISIKHTLGTATGTAFAIGNINNNTYMVTVQHLCETRGKRLVAFSIPDTKAGREKYTGKVVYTDPKNDVCIIRVYETGERFVPLRLAKTAPRAGDKVYTIGAPSGTFPTKTGGYVVGHDLLGMEPDDGSTKVMLVTSIPAFSGNSGGPVYNEQHEVVGMIAATHKKYPHLSISTHVEILFEHLQKYFKRKPNKYYN